MQPLTPIRRFVFAPLVLAAAFGCAPEPAAQAQAPRPRVDPVEAAVASITSDDVRTRVEYLASDELRGRNTPSPGLDSAAAYLVREYERLGLQPGGEGGTFYQRYPLRTVALDLNTAHFGHLLADGSGNQMLTYGTDFVALPAAPTPGLDMNHARLVYVGRLGPDGLPPAQYSGAVPIVTVEGGLRTADLMRARQQATAAGATAVMVVVGPEISPATFSSLGERFARESMILGDLPAGQIAVFVVTDRAFRAIAAREGYEPVATPPSPVPFTRVEAHFAAQLRVVQEAMAPNVVAVLPGSDPELRDEYVILSAHMDHVGVGTPVNGDSIYNGADDDASGTSALVEVAEALAMLPDAPRRSVVFLHVSGEELGLLGSQWYSDHPTLPLEQIVANVNVDMIGRNSPDSVVVIGKDYSSLGELADRVQAERPELGLTLSDDIWPEERFFFRSDHFNFARKEIPSLFFFSGVHEDYHQPSDEVEKLDVDKAARIARMIFHVTRAIADADARPTWKPEGLAEVRALTQ